MRLLSVTTLALTLALAAQANIITYTATLSGANEAPPTGSAGTGFASVTVDSVANTISLNITFSGLTGTTTASHIHCCVAQGGNAGVATTTPTFTGFPSGVTSGTFSNTFDLTQASTYNPAFVTLQGSVPAAEAALLAGLAANQTYLNIHTTTSPGGEIRGFLVATPEPSSALLLLAPLTALACARRRATR